MSLWTSTTASPPMGMGLMGRMGPMAAGGLTATPSPAGDARELPLFAASALKRPPIRYHGSKWRLAPWIISHFPKHQAYVEFFGGGAAVLLRKTRSRVEVYNDLDVQVVNLFRVLRDRTSQAELIRLISLTPFSRDEFELTNATATAPGRSVERRVRLDLTVHPG
jgi:hypothetical protein